MLSKEQVKYVIPKQWEEETVMELNDDIATLDSVVFGVVTLHSNHSFGAPEGQIEEIVKKTFDVVFSRYCEEEELGSTDYTYHHLLIDEVDDVRGRTFTDVIKEVSSPDSIHSATISSHILGYKRHISEVIQLEQAYLYRLVWSHNDTTRRQVAVVSVNATLRKLLGA